MSNDIDDSKKIKLKKTSLIYNTAVLSLWNVMCKKAYTIKKTIEDDIYKYEEIQNDEQDLRKKLEVLDDDFKYKLFKDTIENLKKNPYKNKKNNINDLVDRLKTKENERGELIEYYYKLLEGDTSLFSTVNKYIKKYKDKIRKADITSLPADIIKALNDEKKRQMDNIPQLEELRDQKTQLENINKRLGIQSGGSLQPIVFENSENAELRAAAKEAATKEAEAKKELIKSLNAEKTIIKDLIATKINEINQEKKQINNNFKLLQNLQNINIYDYTINEILSSIENEDLQTKLSDIYSEKSNTEIYRAIIEKLEEYKKYIDKFKEQDKNELISLDNKNFYEKDIDFNNQINGGADDADEADNESRENATALKIQSTQPVSAAQPEKQDKKENAAALKIQSTQPVSAAQPEKQDKNKIPHQITEGVLSNTNLNTVKDVNKEYDIKENKSKYKRMKENYFEKICDKNNDFIEDMEKLDFERKMEEIKENVKKVLNFIIKNINEYIGLIERSSPDNIFKLYFLSIQDEDSLQQLKFDETQQKNLKNFLETQKTAMRTTNEKNRTIYDTELALITIRYLYQKPEIIEREFDYLTQNTNLKNLKLKSPPEINIEQILEEFDNTNTVNEFDKLIDKYESKTWGGIEKGDIEFIKRSFIQYKSEQEKLKIHKKYKNKKNIKCINEDEDIKNLLAFIINFNSKNKLSIIKNIRANINLEPPILKPPKLDEENRAFLDNYDDPNENTLKQLINDANTEIESSKNILETLIKKKTETEQIEKRQATTPIRMPLESTVQGTHEYTFTTTKVTEMSPEEIARIIEYKKYINKLNNFLKTLEGALSQKINSKNIQTIINRNKENIVKELEVIEDKIINIKDKVNMNALDIILLKKKIYLYNKINKDDTEFNETDVKDSNYRNYETEIRNILMIIKNLNNHALRFLQDPNSKIPFESAVDFIKLQIDFLVSKKNCFILPDEESLVTHFNFKNDVVYKNKIDSFYSQTNSFMGKYYIEFFKYLYSNLGPIYDKLDYTDELGQNKLYNIINTFIENLPSNKMSVSVAENTLKRIERKKRKIEIDIKQKFSQSNYYNDSDDRLLFNTIQEQLYNLSKILIRLNIKSDNTDSDLTTRKEPSDSDEGKILKLLKELKDIDSEFIKAKAALNISRAHDPDIKPKLLEKLKKIKNKSNILNTEGRRIGNFTESVINALMYHSQDTEATNKARIIELKNKQKKLKDELSSEDKDELKKLQLIDDISRKSKQDKALLVRAIKYLYDNKNNSKVLDLIGHIKVKNQPINQTKVDKIPDKDVEDKIKALPNDPVNILKGLQDEQPSMALEIFKKIVIEKKQELGTANINDIDILNLSEELRNDLIKIMNKSNKTKILERVTAQILAKITPEERKKFLSSFTKSDGEDGDQQINITDIDSINGLKPEDKMALILEWLKAGLKTPKADAAKFNLTNFLKTNVSNDISFLISKTNETKNEPKKNWNNSDDDFINIQEKNKEKLLGAMLPELEVKVPLPDEYIKSIIRHIVFNDGHFYKTDKEEKLENMYGFNYFSIASKLRETELNISYNKIKNFLEEITKEYINKELKRELTQEDRGRNEMIEKFKKKPDPLKMITDFFDGTEYNDLEDTIDSLNEIGDEIDVELLDDDKKSDIKDQLGDDVDDLILAIIQNLDTFEENIELGLNQWLFIKYILFRIKNSFIYRLRNLGLKTEDIGITGLDEIKIDDLEVIQFLEEITDKNKDIDIDNKEFKITGEGTDEQTKIKPLNINELLTTIQKIRNIEANSAKWNQNTRFIDYVDDILPYLYSQDRFGSILRLKTKLLGVKGGAGQMLNYLNPTNVLFGNSTVERELDRRDSLCMNDNDKFKIELAMNTSAKKQNETPHKFYYGTLFKENDENKRKFLIGPGDILVDIHDNNPSKRGETLENDSKLNILIYEKFDLVKEDNIRLFTYGKSGSGKTYSIKKILDQGGEGIKMHYYDFSEKKFKPYQKWILDDDALPNRKLQDVSKVESNDDLEYYLYLNQFVTENNSQSSRKHICLSYEKTKKYNIIDLCGAERPFSIEKYIKKLDDPLYIEADIADEKKNKITNFRKLLTQFNGDILGANALKDIPDENLNTILTQNLPENVNALNYFKELKLWQEDFIKYIHTENVDNYYKSDIIQQILTPDKSLKQILTTNYRSLIDDEEIEELKKIMDNEELSTENKLAALINSFGENDSFQNDVAYIINRIEYLIYTYAKDSSIIADDILCIKRDGPGRYLSEQKLGNKSFSKKLDSIKIKYFNKPEVELLLQKIGENIENYIKVQKTNATDEKIAELFMEIYNKRIQETEYINRSLDEFSIALTSEKIKKKQKIEKISDLFDINTKEYFGEQNATSEQNKTEFIELYKKKMRNIRGNTPIIRLIKSDGMVINITIRQLLSKKKITDRTGVSDWSNNDNVFVYVDTSGVLKLGPESRIDLMKKKLYKNIIRIILQAHQDEDKDYDKYDIGNQNIVGAQIDYDLLPCLKKVIMVKTNIVPMLPEQSRNNPELFLEFLKMHCHYTDNNDYTKSSLLDLKDIEPGSKNDDSYINMLFGVIDTNKLTKLPQHEIDSLNKFHKEKIVWYIRLILDDDTVNSKHIDELDSLKNLFKLIDPESYKLYEEYVKGQLPPKQDFYGNDLETIYLTNVHSNIAISGEKLALEPIKFTEVSNRNNNAFYVAGGGNITKMDKINLELKNIKKLYKALK